MSEGLISLLLDGVALGCIYALIALGYTMVYGIIKLINFAHGEFYMMGAYAGFFFLPAVSAGRLGRAVAALTAGRVVLSAAQELAAVFLVVMLVAAVAGGVLAVVVERLAYRPLRRATRISALLTALGVSLFLQNVALKAFTPDSRYFSTGIVDRRYPRIAVPQADVRADTEPETDVFYMDENGREQFLAGPAQPVQEETIQAAVRPGASGFYRYPSVTIRKKQIIICASVLIMTIALHFLVTYTRLGKAMRAVSHDLEAAQLMGINVDRVISFTFFIGAFLAGAGGVLVASYYGTIKPGMGVMYGLKAFVAAVLGGIGSIYGAVLGGLVLGMAESLVKLSPRTSPYQDAFAFAVLILILVFMPYGFLGEEEREKV